MEKESTDKTNKKTEIKHKKEGKKQEKKSDKEIIAELTDTLQRLQAEFENYKKRVEKERNEYARYAHAEMILELLPLLDSFELALKSSKIEDFRDTGNSKNFQVSTKNNEKFVKGIEMIFAQLYSILEKEGLRPIIAVGQKFDPYKHEVLMKEKSDKEEDIVLEELQKGYMLGDKVLRHTKVKVSQK